MNRDWSKPQFDLKWMRDEILEKYRGIKAEKNMDNRVANVVADHNDLLTQ